MANQQTNQTANQQLKDQLDSYKSRISKSRRRKRIAYIVGLCLVAVAIVGLVVPAATLEFGKTYCGQEEHSHTDACVNRTMVCALPDTSNGNGHVHVPSCYDEQGVLACGKTAVAHMHLPSCVNAQGTALVCGQEETVHMHTISCVDTATNKYACGAEDLPHVHGVTCYDLQDGAYVLVCSKPSVGHVHTLLCLDPNTGEVTCGQEEAIELKHVHSDACYDEELICGMEEHVHNELCYDEITEAIMKKDEESSAAKEAAEEAEGVEPGVAEGDLTEEEITEAKDQGLLFENEDVIVVFDAPEKIKDDIVLTVTETDEEVEFVEAVDATEEVNAEGEPADDETAQDGDNGEPVFFSEAGEEAESTTEVGDLRDSFGNPTEEDDPAVVSLTQSQGNEAAYQINLHVEATLAGEPVEDIAELGLTAKLQMKPRVIAPILAEINYSEVDPQIKSEVGAEITVLQQPENASDATISEIQAEQVDEIVVTSVQEATTSFEVVASVFTAKAASTPNPNFTVEYWAPVEVPILNNNGKLAVINTRNNGEGTGSNMPTNTSSLPTTKINLDSNGTVVTNTTTNKKIYKDKECTYYAAPSLDHFNKVAKNTNYILSKIKVVKADGSDQIYDYKEGVTYFTNRSESEGERNGKFYILIENKSVIRLIFSLTRDNFDIDTTFYDYDISNGWIYRAKPPANQGPSYYQHKTAGEAFNGNNLTNSILTWAGGLSNWDKHLYTYTLEQGINSSGNYSGSGTKLAFGNVNTGTGLGKLTWNGNELNKYNNKGYLGCTFGLVSGLTNEGNVVYASGVQAPKLFNEGEATGKTTFGDYDLDFKRAGDTYTLSSVKGTGAINLDTFTNPSNSSGTHTDIHTNNFWPMDSASSFGTGTHDVKFGGTATFKGGAHELRFGPTTQKGTDYTLPESDDGQYHNSYFGMSYNVDFSLDEEYIGPLEYLFFGDDDLWIFLSPLNDNGTPDNPDDDYIDGKSELVVDIGGVHSSVGEYVDLWDHIKKGTSGKYRLSVFYTERGASGSTCYMNFTLPSVSTSINDQDTGSVIIEKKVDAPTGSDAVNNTFDFTINLTDADGNELPNDYSYTRYFKDTSKKPESNLIIWDGGSFQLQDGDYIKIDYLPIGAKYTIQEDFNGTKPLYQISWEFYEDSSTPTQTSSGEDIGSLPASFTGQVKNKEASYRLIYTNKVPPQLPATGGEGTYWYWIGGGLLVALGLLMLWRKQTLTATPASSFTKAEASVLAFFGDTQYASPSGKPESVYSKGWSRANKGDEATRKGGRY